jgi:hypothetical protein
MGMYAYITTVIDRGHATFDVCEVAPGNSFTSTRGTITVTFYDTLEEAVAARDLDLRAMSTAQAIVDSIPDPGHTRDGWMTPEHHAEYLAAIKPLTDLHGTEHDAWLTGSYEPDDVWHAAMAVSDRLMDALYREDERNGK